MSNSWGDMPGMQASQPSGGGAAAWDELRAPDSQAGGSTGRTSGGQGAGGAGYSSTDIASAKPEYLCAGA
jgi:hypothetical protein